MARRAIFTSSRDVFRFIWAHPANRNRRVRQLGKAVSFQLQARLLHRRAQAMVGETARIQDSQHEGIVRLWFDSLERVARSPDGLWLTASPHLRGTVVVR